MTRELTLRQSINAMMKARTAPITKLADPNGGISPGRRIRHNLGEGWHRIVRRTDPSKPAGPRQFIGRYVNNEIEEQIGTMVLQRMPEAGYTLMILTPGVGLSTVMKDKLATATMRRVAEEVLLDPAAEVERQIAEAMTEADLATSQLHEIGPPRRTLVSESGAAAYHERELRRKLTEATRRFAAIADAMPHTT